MNYIKKAQKVKKGVDKEINLLLENIEFGKELKPLFEQRQKKQMYMRPFLTQLIYELEGGEKIISQTNAVSEINNLHQYVRNWQLDNKADFRRGKINTNEISFLFSQLGIMSHQMISQINLRPDLELRVRNFLDYGNSCCDRGQQLDLEMSIDKLGEFTEKEFLNWYLEKSQLMSGNLYGFSAHLGSIVASNSISENSIKKSQNAFEFGKLLGTGIQITNDLGDFAPIENDTFKSYKDQFADLKNRRLTLPIFYCLKYGDSQEKKALYQVAEKQSDSTKDEMIQASKAIVTSKAFDKTKKIINLCYKNTRACLKEYYPKSIQRNMLTRMVSVIKDNKGIKYNRLFS